MPDSIRGGGPRPPLDLSQLKVEQNKLGDVGNKAPDAIRGADDKLSGPAWDAGKLGDDTKLHTFERVKVGRMGELLGGKLGSNKGGVSNKDEGASVASEVAHLGDVQGKATDKTFGESLKHHGDANKLGGPKSNDLKAGEDGLKQGGLKHDGLKHEGSKGEALRVGDFTGGMGGRTVGGNKLKGGDSLKVGNLGGGATAQEVAAKAAELHERSSSDGKLTSYEKGQIESSKRAAELAGQKLEADKVGSDVNKLGANKLAGD